MPAEAPSRIHVLSSALASQIAAGEVVERPASAVKELVENAVDAGASRIDVTIEGGGITRLSVSDDGAGMTARDVELAIRRHATSKLERFEDLQRLRTFGFRGEALPSIASVSRFRLITRATGDEAGTELSVEAGGAPEIRPHGRAAGTTVEVRDLFYNVPARRKFMRSSGTESSHVTEVLEALALSQPRVTFTLARDGRQVREWLRAGAREERVAQVLDEPELAAVSGERGPLGVSAFLSRPERARQGATALRLFVNDRPVKDRAIAATIAQAYGSVLERGRYPRGVVFLELPPELVDVNVHPQKAEVRFADPRAVTDALYGIVAHKLASAFSLPPPARSAWTERRAEPLVRPGDARQPLVLGDSALPMPLQARRPVAPREGGAGEASVEPRFSPSEPLPAPRTALEVSAPGSPEAEPRWAKLRFVAQVRHTYLLCEGDAGIYVLDQHAASERVTFSRLRRDYAARAVSSQALLFPENIAVTAEEAEVVEERSQAFIDVGLDVRRRSADVVSVHGIPRLLHHASAERLLRDLVSELLRTGGRGFSDAVDRALATMACHGSLRAGDALSGAEAQALLHALDEADFSGHCPHGRPIVTSLSWADLERRVGRR